jgi:outer membrane protein assembly factor BamB
VPDSEPPRQPGKADPAEGARSKPAKPVENRRAPPGPDTEPGMPPGPRELPAGAWEAPPIRAPGTASAPGEPVTAHTTEPAATARRRAKLITAALVLVVAGLVGGGVWFVQNILGQTEANRLAQARQEYASQNFVEAAKQFGSLQKDYPHSNRLSEYQFYAALSEVRQPAYTRASPERTRLGYEKFLRFLEQHQGNEFLKSSPEDIRDTLYKFAAQLTEWAEQKGDAGLVATARQVLAEARKYADGKDDEQSQALATRLDAVVTNLQTKEKRQQLLDRLEKLAVHPSGEAYRQARELIQRAGRDDPSLPGDKDVLHGLDRVAQEHRAQVRYTPVVQPDADTAPPEDTEPSLLIAPPVGGLGLKSWPRQRPVLALARGVLYALRPSDGSVRWATRVGIDTTVLPVRLPARAPVPAILLVASSDSNTLSALDASDGRAIWHHRLTAPCLGRPTVVWEDREQREARRIYVPCSDGRVDEIDPATGKLQGYYQLGQSVRHGGVYDENSGLLYLAADSSCVFVLNLARHTCERILYTEHHSGSLRGDPTIVCWQDVAAEGSGNPNASRGGLLMCQASGFETTELHLYSLPITKPDAAPLPLNLRVRGWSWFAPLQDAEKLALATDAGAVAVFGVRQPSNRDPLLYPMLAKDYFLDRPEHSGNPGSRAELAHFDASNFWVLAHGELHRLRLALGPGGWTMTKLWSNPVALGGPLHGAQVDPTRKLLFFVTQPGAAQICLASAVRSEAEADDRDKVPWQTQLGLVGQGDPLVVQEAVLVQDQRGGLFRFDAKKYKDTDVAWHIHERLTAQPRFEEGSRALRLLPIAGGALGLITTGKGRPERLIIRHFDAATGKVTDHACPLTAPLAGTPGAWADNLVLPLASGVLVRKDMPGGDPLAGLDWRAERADENAAGHVVPLNLTDFLVTNGSGGLVRMSWPKGGECQKKTQKDLPARLTAAPLVRLAGANEFQVYVADAEDHVTMLRGDLTTDSLEVVRRVPLGGKISAGPFVLGQGVGCVVDQRRLVLLDAAENKPVWTYRADGPLVGRPASLGGLFIVADAEGRFVGLDPATGKRCGQGYRLKANVAAASTPVPLGTDRLFAPLTDGTVLLLSLKRFQPAPAKKEALPERFF